MGLRDLRKVRADRESDSEGSRDPSREASPCEPASPDQNVPPHRNHKQTHGAAQRGAPLSRTEQARKVAAQQDADYEAARLARLKVSQAPTNGEEPATRMPVFKDCAELAPAPNIEVTRLALKFVPPTVVLEYTDLETQEYHQRSMRVTSKHLDVDFALSRLLHNNPLHLHPHLVSHTQLKRIVTTLVEENRRAASLCPPVAEYRCE